MKDKEKQITEMANDIYGLKSCDTSFEESCKLLAYDLVTLGWIKPPEDSVVLSMKEYEILKGERKLCDKCGYYFLSGWSECPKCGNKPTDSKQVRKETAEKFADLLFSHITTREVWEELRALWLNIGGGKKANLHIWYLLIEPIAKQFGCEIKGE